MRDVIPTTKIDREELARGIGAIDLFVRVGLCQSRSEARRLIEQGGAYVNGKRIAAADRVITTKDLAGVTCES